MRNGAIFIDLDGTFFKWGTNVPLPHAVSTIEQWHSEGHQIIFTTRRDTDMAKIYKDHDPGITQEALDNLFPNIPFRIMFGVENPRVIINDDGCKAIPVRRDDVFDHDLDGVVNEREKSLAEDLYNIERIAHQALKTL